MNSILESPPALNFLMESLQKLTRPEVKAVINRAQYEYLYWDKVKYLPLPEDITIEELWSLVKLSRYQGYQKVEIKNYSFSYYLTVFLQKLLHEFDMNFGGQLSTSSKLTEDDRRKFLISSIMEEAISSSQIEGAVTTRRVAKEMLRQQRSPRNKSELMILNNYQTIQHIRSISQEPLTETNLLELHRLMTSNTLDNPNDAGRFRIDNEVNVVDHVSGAIVHRPPDVATLSELMQELYDFFNDNSNEFFIHPIIKASVVHFLIGFIHPFIDGNGRTARALFYWYMLKKGYWLTEHLSISSVILKSRAQYAKAFLYTETDGLDLTYFLHYKARTIRLAYENLQLYLKRKMEEKKAFSRFINIGGINERQAQILQWLTDEPERVFTVKEMEIYFNVANQTARTDLTALAKLDFLEIKNINKKKQVFIRNTKKKY